MKSSAACLLAALLRTHETINPDYIVEYKCNWLRIGKRHTGINSPAECAALARDAGATSSTYHPPTKKCVAQVDEEDHFKEDEDEEETFAMTCDEEKEACLERETALKAELASSKNQLAASQAEKRPQYHIQQHG
ncbi:hypothetical protein QSH57_009799 [Fusarium oxysporum f. sp. vasinfectum]|nr:hypothetical protein QSH57_009799 [Fusarium oxysporum f. sp. vasinfectum]